MLLNHREEPGCLFFFGERIQHRFFDQLLSLALLSEGTFPKSSFQLPRMQNRRATVPSRHISPLIEGSLGA
jgi:hypothetical protein